MLDIDSTAHIIFARQDLMLEYDAQPNKRYIYILPFSSAGSINQTTEKPEETWNIGLFIYKQDRMDSGADQNDPTILQDEMELVDDAMYFADELIRLANFNTITDALNRASQQLSITSFGKEPAIKETAHLLTGVLVNMSIQVPDNFDYCTIND